MDSLSIISKLAGDFNSARSSYLAKKAFTRTRKLTFGLRQLIGEPANGSKFLDLGCGVGNISTLAVKDKFEVCGLDRDRSQLLYKIDEKINLGINLITGDGQRLPFRDEYFDVVYCCHVLEHIGDDYSTLAEINRVLKDGGIFLLSVPNTFNLSTKFKKKLKLKSSLISGEHLREYKKDEVIVLLNGCGFHILDSKMTGFLLPFGNIIFNFATLQFGLQKIKSYLAERFPESSESIDIAAEKGWHEKEDKSLQTFERVFPLPWWLK